jgi:hypothetical protein
MSKTLHQAVCSICLRSQRRLEPRRHSRQLDLWPQSVEESVYRGFHLPGVPQGLSISQHHLAHLTRVEHDLATSLRMRPTEEDIPRGAPGSHRCLPQVDDLVIQQFASDSTTPQL